MRDGAVALDLYNEFKFELALEFHLSLGGARGQPLLAEAETRLLREIYDRLRSVGIDPMLSGLPVP